ncbi:MAG: ABC transporter ATP-binding protein [Patescibacteria group bacterium]|nr:ABC transporter ATP-binding protein/permease [Patescibacteria group bacterium]MBU2509454.1 ABC transporter ATP-binding protein/permease [Patescibacteria group bacterium]
MEQITFTPPKEKPSPKEILRALPFTLRMIYESDKRSFIIKILASVLNAPFAALGVIAIKKLADAALASRMEDIFFWATMLILSTLLIGLSVFLEERFMNYLRHNFEVAFKGRALKHMTMLPFWVLEDPGFRMLEDAFNRKSWIMINMNQWLMNTFVLIFTFLGLMTVLIYLPPIASLVILASFVVSYFLTKKEAKFSWSVFTQENREGRRAYYHEEIIMRPISLLEAKGWGLQRPFLALWNKFTSRLLQLRHKETVISTRIYAVTNILKAFGLAVGLIFTLRDPTLLSSAVVFIASYSQIWSTTERLSYNIRMIFRDGSFLTIFKRFFEVPHEKNVGAKLPQDPLLIRFEDVWFRYPGTRVDVLRGVTFEFKEGDHIGIVGLNGAGKSTLIKLLMKIYEPTKGKITINGLDLKDIKPTAWREALSVMQQSTQVYDDTLRNQVIYGQFTGADDKKRFRMALATSGMDKMIKEFSAGLETHAGKMYAMPEDEAIELSGGQRQIVAIARSLYRDARLYIFDEPTSSVDAEKEERFFERLPDALQSEALIFVSHRFSTLRRAEKIMVIDNGQIIEDGTHEELMFKKGKYAELFTLQAKLYQ